MIDYLERLFVREGEEDGSSPSLLQMEEAQIQSVSRFREEQWQKEAQRRLERALSVPAAGAVRLPEERPEPLVRPILSREEPVFDNFRAQESIQIRETDGVQELERRLRRDSRRYDSGFFQY